ncbi:hypothetical protein [Azospirillum argentinense]|uniref:ATP-dependent DNA ligase n=1 Tax=Azospirillum argentinense TaxID=2970906 RepID=UPI0032DF0C6E
MIGTDVLSVLRQIEATGSRTEKEEILGRCMSDGLMAKVLRYAYDPYVTFGVTPPKVAGAGQQVLTVDSPVWLVLDHLAARRITGSEAKELVKEWLLDVLDADNSQLLWRVLSKDLRCGITAKTVNKVLPGTIPVFDVMLAHKFEDKRYDGTTWAAEPKLDGLRSIGLIDSSKGAYFSRVGNVFPALVPLVSPVQEMIGQAREALEHRTLPLDEKLREAYWKMLGGDRGASLATDGEVVTGSFNESVGAVRRKSEKAEDAILFLFDALPRPFFEPDAKSVFPMKYRHRRAFLEFLAKFADPMKIRTVPRYLVNSVAEINAYYEKFRAITMAEFLARGDLAMENRLREQMIDRKTGLPKTLEGAIAKPLDGVYEKKRSQNWLKLKAEETIELRCVGVAEGIGKYAGMVGAIVVDFEGVKVPASGMSDLQRRLWWDDPSLVVGHLVEIEYHEVTPAGSLRHPRYVRHRDDKDEELKAA